MSKKKIVTACLVVALLATGLIGGSLAYFTDTHSQANTFTAGKVGIALDEAVVEKDANGDLVAKDKENDRTTDPQSYELYPAMTVTKDPTITVDAGSNDAYVAAKVTVNGNIKGLIGVEGYDNIDITKLASGGLMGDVATQATGWNGLPMVYETAECVIYQDATAAANNTWTLYVFMKEAQAAGEDIVLFDTLTIPADWDNDEMAKINGMTINVEAYATQTNGFADCFDAMTTAFATAFAF